MASSRPYRNPESVYFYAVERQQQPDAEHHSQAGRIRIPAEDRDRTSEHEWLQIEIGDAADDKDVHVVKCTIHRDKLLQEPSSQFVQTRAADEPPDCSLWRSRSIVVSP
jgi:hypothetical protein